MCFVNGIKCKMERKHYYTDEKNAQIVIALLKAHAIRDIVISPGATNDCFVLSVQDDSDFKLYSAVDERHAGYLACGIAQESGRPVVINCTGATASRNYMSALTEAFYRKLPIIALTCSQHSSHIGNLYPQMTDRIHLPADIVNMSVQCQIPHTKEEEWACQLNVNRAILETRRHGGGPVHINLETGFCGGYTCETLPKIRPVERVFPTDVAWPKIPQRAKVAIWIGAHGVFTEKEINAIDAFVESYDAVVLTDLTSNYAGKRAVRPSILLAQTCIRQNPQFDGLKPDLIIHIGEVSGDYPTMNFLVSIAPVWRVSEDGELRDRLHRLEAVFEMPIETFFSHYAKDVAQGHDGYCQLWNNAIDALQSAFPQIPFSNLWIARELSRRLPERSVLHLGILNPLRCWNMSKAKPRRAYSLVGGFGIDGGTSSLIGSALAAPDDLHFGVFGDLSFFYDLNALGNRHVPTNLRILLINNGEGAEFSVPHNISSNPNCADRVHAFIAAEGHNGRRSSVVVKQFAEALGFLYLSCTRKEEFDLVAGQFAQETSPSPIILECFTRVEDDCGALEICGNIQPYETDSFISDVRGVANRLMPRRVKSVIKAALGK